MGHVHLLPLAVLAYQVVQRGILDAALVGDKGAEGDFGQCAEVHLVVHGVVQDAHGVVGGNLLGDAVDGAAGAVVGAHVDAVERVAGIELLHSLDVGAVPCGSRHVVHIDGREAGLQDVVVHDQVVGIGACKIPIFLLVIPAAAVVVGGEGQVAPVNV